MSTSLYKITQQDIDAILSQLKLDGNKVLAIKNTRLLLDCGLKEAKDLVEDAFSPACCDKYKVEIENRDTPGYYIDRIFALSKELAECYSALKSSGFKF